MLSVSISFDFSTKGFWGESYDAVQSIKVTFSRVLGLFKTYTALADH